MPRKKSPAKQTRGPRGEGTVIPDKRRGGWIGRVPVGRLPSGRTRYKEVRGKTQAEAVAKKKLVLPPSDDITVGEWADRWLAGLRIREGTMDGYKVCVRHRIKPCFGDVQLRRLTTWHIESSIPLWRDPGTGEPLAVSTIRNTLAQIAGCLQAAVKAELIQRNPATFVRRPAIPKVKFDLFSPEELRKIIDTAATNPKWYPFALCAAMGLRIGEACAIFPGDYDPDVGTLSIRRTRTRKGTNPPKSPNSLRTIRVPAVVQPLLAEGVNGAAHATMDRRWEACLKKAGLRRRVMHQMRHSVATHSLAAGVPLTNVARDLGDTADTIVRTYLHHTPGSDVCEAMERLLGGGSVAPELTKPAKTRRKATS